jgi:2-oxoglutarate ferredoxin oxidoreductase subunit alpha
MDLAERLQTPSSCSQRPGHGHEPLDHQRVRVPGQAARPRQGAQRRGFGQFKEKHNGQRWGRYLDVDGDGIPYRTLPGTEHPAAAYFTRGSGHTAYATYSERPDVWENNLKRIERKFESARHLVPAPLVVDTVGSHIGILSFGSNHEAIVEARARLEKAGIGVGYMRLRALPINEEVRAFIEHHDKIFVVENNMDGQLATILRSELPDLATKLVSLAKCDGMPLSARWITEQIAAAEYRLRDSAAKTPREDATWRLCVR